MSELESVEVPSVPTPTEKKPEREGLPPSYRMRADAHYVDQLTTSRRSAEITRIDPVSPSGQSGRPEARRDQIDGGGEPRHRRSDRVLAQLSENIATIQSAAALVASEASPVARRISLDLIRAHAWRAGWLFRAHQVLDGLHRMQERPRPIGGILGQVRDSLAPECRLTGSSLTIRCADWNAEVDVDEDMLVAGIAGGVLATLELAGPHDGLGIEVAATLANGELRTIEVTQNNVRVSAAAGHWTASLGATVAKSVAHLTGGEVVFLAGDKRGSTVRFAFR